MRRGFRQKPWNKVARIEKFWTTCPTLPNAAVYTLVAGSNNAEQIMGLTGPELAADQTLAAIGQRALQHVKIHRIQGHLWAWCAPLDGDRISGAASSTTVGAYPDTSPQIPNTGNDVPPNIVMLNYVWLKLKTDANTPSDPTTLGVPADFNPNVTHDLANLLERDDILSWGTIPIFGAVVRMYTTQPATNTQAMQVANPGQYFQDHVAKIPLPRVPKMGLNLRKGESLACFAAIWDGPGSITSNNIDDVTPPRGVIVYPTLRLLCSV